MATSNEQNLVLLGDEYHNELIRRLDAATKHVVVLMYDWRWYPHDPASIMQRLNQAFVRAVRRGVSVHAITNNDRIIDILSKQGIIAQKWDQEKIMHSKMVSIDHKLAFVGSHNFTKRAAGSNHELSLMINDPELAAGLAFYFQSLWH